jgi:hypothetical protein
MAAREFQHNGSRANRISNEDSMTWTKKSGHWKWEEADGGSVDFSDTITEMLERPFPQTGDRWGKWIYSIEGNVLYFDPATNNYPVRLDTIRTAEDLADWLAQLQEKTWMSPADFGDFLEAVDDFIGLRKLAHPG